VEGEPKIIDLIRETAKKRILFLPHAVRQMSRADRMISTSEIRSMIEKGELIEDYPEDARGHSCLLLGFGNEKRPLHVVCAPKENYLAIITAYLPESDQWEDNLRKRKKK
jgi:hypothetical protein